MKTSTIHSVHPADCRQHQWDEDDLVTRLSEALDFAEGLLQQLSDRDSTGLVHIAKVDELIAETAIFLLAASNIASYTAIGPRILRVATLLEPHAHSKYLLRKICLEPALAFDHAIAHICLKRLGFYECDFDAMLDLAAASQAADGRGRRPHQMIQQEWLKQGWLYPEGLRRLRCGSHIALSALNRSIDLLQGSPEDVASFTHALMYMTDFNLFPRSLPRPGEVLLLEAEGMLARCLHEQDYTQAAEVLMAWPLTGEEWSPAAAFGFRVVVRAAKTRQSALRTTKSIDREEYQAIYRTGLLCAVSLDDRRLPPVAIPRCFNPAGAFAAVLDLIETGPVRALWQAELDGLNGEEGEYLAEFLLSIALHQQFGRRDFTAMQQVLHVGKAIGLAGSPLAQQATEMIGRTRQFADSLVASDAPQPHDVSVCA